MNAKGTVTQLLEQLRSTQTQERNQAAAALWERYAPKLLALARAKLSPRLRQRVDAEDVVQVMYASFCKRLEKGQFQLEDRDDLWRLLVTMTINKVRKAARYHGRDKRTFQREQVASGSTENDDQGFLAEVVEDRGSLEEFAQELNELLEQLLHDLGDRKLYDIVLLKLEGHTNIEIAAQLECSTRSVERKLELIRKVKWRQVE